MVDIPAYHAKGTNGQGANVYIIRRIHVTSEMVAESDVFPLGDDPYALVVETLNGDIATVVTASRFPQVAEQFRQQTGQDVSSAVSE
jgi:hypothetical protein